MKYIVFEEEKGPVAIVFEERLHHIAVGKSIERAYANSDHLMAYPISAGFCYVRQGIWTVEGRSESMNLDSRPEDAGIINRLYYGRKREPE